jgi:hypothetical protein
MNLKMKSIKKYSTLFLLSYSTLGFSQANVNGRVKDEQQTLPSATVLLLSADSTLVKGMVTDINGEFLFENVAPGKYRIASSMIGYSKSFSSEILLKDKSITIPDIILQEATTELNEVVVKAEKPLFEQQIDRLVMNVQSSITSSGNSILELLQKSPGIVVNRQNNSIAMNGKSGVRVMINNKLMQLPLDVVVQMLDGMNSSNVEKIELITTPPSKYDAEGNAGIIHIVMKENLDFGTNGTVGLTLGAHAKETVGGNFNLNHRNGRFNYFIDYSILRNNNVHAFTINRESLEDGFLKTVDDKSHRDNVTTQQNLNGGFEWKLSNRTALNLLFSGYRRNWQMNALAEDINREASNSTIITNLKVYEGNIWQSATGSMGLQTKINKKSDIGFNVDYLYYHNSNPSNYDNKLLYEQSNQEEAAKIDLQKETPIHIVIAKSDYQYSFSPSFGIEAGVKGVASNLDNNVLVQRYANNVWTIDPKFTSYSNLNEQIGAGYVSAKWQGERKWQANGGLRYEYTHTAISTPTEKNLVNRKYGYFFPSLFLKKNIGSEKDIQLSYSRRITRPTYNDIAPFVFFWGPNTFSAGNTSLWPSVSEAVKAGYHLKQWIFSLQYTHARREISAFQPEVDSKTNSLIYRSQNLKYLNTLSFTNSYSIHLTGWWELQSNVTGQYQTATTSHLANNLTYSLYGWNANLINIIKLPKDFALEVSGFYQSKSIFGISLFQPLGSLNAGIQKKFGEKGSLRFSMDDILYTNLWRIKTYSDQNNLNTYLRYDLHNQFVRLSYSRNFGNNKLRSVKLKSGSDEERGRVN